MAYIYYLHNKVTIQTIFRPNSEVSNDWFDIQPNGEINIKGHFNKPYAWNGCSPKFIVKGVVIGTPEGRTYIDPKARGLGFLQYVPNDYKPSTWLPTLIHDVCYQFALELEEAGITRKQVDRQFLLDLQEYKFEASSIYYYAVRFVGWAYWMAAKNRQLKEFEKEWQDEMNANNRCHKCGFHNDVKCYLCSGRYD
jgi:hypothetical protein